MADDDCQLCSGRGRLTCTMCIGLGYRTVSGERVTCGCSAGYVDCPSCEGTGRRKAAMLEPGPLDDNTADDLKTLEESPDSVRAGMNQLRQHIQRGINRCSLLPFALRNDWVDRLANLTDANCVAELETLRREVKSVYEKRT